MDNKSIFSDEYSSGTETKTINSAVEETEIFQVDSERYGISKPKRKIIRTKVTSPLKLKPLESRVSGC
ncbi:MAG: hypothetical protein IT362_08545 [Deltaproteobacteria bacterium]|nr:hypothetical protein [Deltaproteobacteria bacterium]